MAVMISPSMPMMRPFSSWQYGMSLSTATIRTPGLIVLIAGVCATEVALITRSVTTSILR